MLIGLEDRDPIHPHPPAENKNNEKADSAHLKLVAPEQKKRPAGPYPFRSDDWASAYSRRIDATIAALKSKGVPVIWVGLPAIRGTRSTSDMIYLNDLFRARAERAGIDYVDVWDGFVDDSGRFVSYGPDLEGQVRRLRTPDGVYFTTAGARKLAHYVEREINRVIGTRLPPTAMPVLDEQGNPIASAPGERPAAGPVYSLTQVPTVETLLGGEANGRHADPLAANVLVKGESLPPQSGRADDFFLTPEAAKAAAAAAEKATPKPAKAAPQKPQAAKPQAKTEAAVGEPAGTFAAKPGASAASLPAAATVAKPAPASPKATLSERELAAKPSDASAPEARTPPQPHRSAAERTTSHRPRERRPVQRRPVQRRPQQPPVFDPFGLFR